MGDGSMDEIEKAQDAVAEREAEARRLTERIKLNLTTWVDAYEKLVPLIREAFETQAWVAMGYRKNGHARWIEDNFAEVLGRLPGPVRKELTARLMEDVPGISTRGVAALTGVDESTVREDLGSRTAGNPAGSDPDPADHSASSHPTQNTGRDIDIPPTPPAEDFSGGEDSQPQKDLMQAVHDLDGQMRKSEDGMRGTARVIQFLSDLPGSPAHPQMLRTFEQIINDLRALSDGYGAQADFLAAIVKGGGFSDEELARLTSEGK